MSEEMRYTHMEGHCVLKYSPDGSRVFTGGADGEVRVFSGIEDSENQSHLIGDETLALAVGSETFYASASNTNKVTSYSNADGSENGVMIRFTAEVTSLDVWQNRLAGGSEDMTIRVRELDSSKEQVLKGHQAPVLCVALEPTPGGFLVSTSCDGSIKLWDVDKGTCVKTIEGALPKSSDFVTSKTLSQCRWNPAGVPIFAVAHRDRVVSYDGVSGGKIQEYKFSSASYGAEEYVQVLDWSSDGNYIVAGTSSARIVIWSVEDKTIIHEYKSSKSKEIRSIAWCPSKINEVSFLNDQAYWGVLSDLMIHSQSKPIIGDQETFNEEELAEMFDEDDDDENSFSLRKIKVASGFDEDEDGETKFLPKNVDSDSNLDTVLDELKKENRETIESSFVPSAPKVEIQEPFQSSSTPSHLSSRFMVWNSIGIVKSFNSEDENSVDVEFHDTSVHHPLHVPNHDNYSMAALSNVALALASEAMGEEGEEDYIKSKLGVNYFSSSDVNKEWSIEMSNGEEILAVSVGSDWVAVATDKRNIRVFSLAGIQHDIFSLPGPIVTLSGYGQYLIIVTHSGTPLPENQSMLHAILDLSKHRKHVVPYFVPLPLSPCSLLSWVGFSDEGTPTAKDGAGIVRIFNRGLRQWTQVCDTSHFSKGKSDHYFMLGLSEKEDAVRVILCKGSRFPTTIPKPTVTVLSLQIPLCEHGTEKTSLEEKYLKQGLINDEDDSIATNESLIKLFALAIKSDREVRAYEVCKLMNADTIQIAIKYASKLGRLQLANKLNELARIASEMEEKEEQKNINLFSQNDMFETQEEDIEDSPEIVHNPLLEAKLKRRNQTLKSMRETESQEENRNPFKKSRNGSAQVGSIRPGLVFDSISNQSPSANKPTQSFGSRLIEKKETLPKKTERQKLITLSPALRNDGSNTSKINTLRGFQLWLAENPQDLTSIEDNQSVGLNMWKKLTKDEKEKYKIPRAPVSRSASSRKRQLEDDSNDKHNSKKNTSSRLSAFAAPE